MAVNSLLVPRRLPVAALWVVVALYFVQVPAWWGQVNDDAFITFRYSRMTALGHGPVFNAGEHVEGYTNPLLMLLLVPVAGPAPGTVAVVAKALGVAAGAATLVVAYLLVRRLLGEHERLGSHAEWLGAAAAGLVCADPDVLVNATSGLETLLFSFLLLLGLERMSARHERRLLGAGPVFALLALTRPEGAALFAVAWMGGLVTKRLRRPLAALAIVGATVLAHLAFRLAFYGAWLPNTFHAKRGGFWTSPTDYLHGGLLEPFLGPFGVAAGVLGALLWLRRHPDGAPLAAVACAGFAMPFVTGTDWMLGHRLMVPYVAVLACLWVCGVAHVAAAVLGGLEAEDRRRAGAVAPALVCALAAIQAVRAQGFEHVERMRDTVSLRARGYETGHRALARWIAQRARPGDAVALMDIGIVGYTCIEQRIIDVTGLTDPFVARSEGAFLTKTYDPRYVLDQEPRFIVLTLKVEGRSYESPTGGGFHHWTPMEERIAEHPAFVRDYVRRRPPSAALIEWKEALRDQIGAELVVEHGHPGLIYLLAAFERRTER
jgi:hypothetical protein